MHSTCSGANAPDDQTVLKFFKKWGEEFFCHDVPVFCPTLIKYEEQE